MFRHARIFTMLAAVMLALVFSVGSAGTVSAQSQGCDTTGTRNGTATPTHGTTGTVIMLRATGFTPGEEVSFWFTVPDGRVAGTAAPVAGGVNPDGSIGPLPFEIEQRDVDTFPGRWAITFQGASSNNTAVIYFCVLTQQQATAVAQPATATAAPATATTAATATVPATATTVAPAVSPTVAATNTVVAATATTAPALPTDTVAPVMPVETATTVAIPTEVMPVETPMGGGAGTGDLPGMPTAGQSDGSMFATLVLAALGLLGLGFIARRAKGVSR